MIFSKNGMQRPGGAYFVNRHDTFWKEETFSFPKHQNFLKSIKNSCRKSENLKKVSPCLASSRVVGVHFGNPTPKLRPSGPRPSPRAPDGQDPAHQHGIRPSLSQNLREEKIGEHFICPRLPSGHCPPGYRARPRHGGAPAPPARPRRAAVWGGMAI